MKNAAKSAGVPMQFQRIGSMFCGYFTGEPVHNLADAMKSDRERFKRYFHGMLAEGIYLAPSQFEAGSSPPPTRPRTSSARWPWRVGCLDGSADWRAGEAANPGFPSHGSASAIMAASRHHGLA